MFEVTVITNNVPRDIVEAWELTAAEREWFDYVDWTAIEDGSDSASFFRYKGELYDLGDIPAVPPAAQRAAGPEWMSGWHGYLPDSFFSGILVRYCDDDERVVVGRFYC